MEELKKIIKKLEAYRNKETSKKDESGLILISNAIDSIEEYIEFNKQLENEL